MFGTKIYFFTSLASVTGNPDSENCWVAPDDKQVYENAIEGEEMINYGELFRDWFTYGAVLFMIAIFLQVIALVVASAGTGAQSVLRVIRLL